jgi:glycosyltransferase involved in cell wall biosynthesis
MPNNIPIFSIIIPTYNSEQTLQKCLESVINQCFTGFEILIMDSVSTDSTLEIAKSFNDARIKIFSEKDEGVYDAMNKGIDKAKGEWLYFLGSDDELYNNDVLYKTHEVICCKPYDLIYGNVIFKSNNQVFDGAFDLLKLCTKTNMCHQSIFYKKELFYRLGMYNLKYKISADYDFNIRCFSHPAVATCYTDQIISKYNNTTGLSARKKDMVFSQVLPAYYKYLYQDILTSRDYKIGKLLLDPFRKIRDIIKRNR